GRMCLCSNRGRRIRRIRSSLLAAFGLDVCPQHLSPLLSRRKVLFAEGRQALPRSFAELQPFNGRNVRKSFVSQDTGGGVNAGAFALLRHRQTIARILVGGEHELSYTLPRVIILLAHSICGRKPPKARGWKQCQEAAAEHRLLALRRHSLQA